MEIVRVGVLDTCVLLADRTVLLHSKIGYWHHHVVRLSVCLHYVSQGQCTGLKLYQCVPSRQVPICPFRHYCCSRWLCII